MKIKVYTIYFNGERDTMFLTRKSAKKYMEYLSFYSFNDDNKFYYRKEYIYV